MSLLFFLEFFMVLLRSLFDFLRGVLIFLQCIRIEHQKGAWFHTLMSYKQLIIEVQHRNVLVVKKFSFCVMFFYSSDHLGVVSSAFADCTEFEKTSVSLEMVNIPAITSEGIANSNLHSLSTSSVELKKTFVDTFFIQETLL